MRITLLIAVSCVCNLLISGCATTVPAIRGTVDIRPDLPPQKWINVDLRATAVPKATSHQSQERVDARSMYQANPAKTANGSPPKVDYQCHQQCKTLHADMQRAYMGFDYDTVVGIAERLLYRPCATRTQKWDALMMAGAACYLEHDLDNARKIFRKAYTLAPQACPDDKFYPHAIRLLYAQSTLAGREGGAP